MQIILAIILIVIFFPVLVGLLPLVGVFLIVGIAVYGVLMILKMIFMATGHYHYNHKDMNKINNDFGTNWTANDFNNNKQINKIGTSNGRPFLGWLVIITGAILGYVMSINKGYFHDEFSYPIAITIWGISILIGALLFNIPKKKKDKELNNILPHMSEEETKLYNTWNILVNGAKNILVNSTKASTYLCIKVKYYKGHRILDEMGDYSNKEFYCYSAYGLDDFVLFLLEVNYTKGVFVLLVSKSELEYYTVSPDRKMTIISTLHKTIKQEIYVSASVYKALLKYYPTKDLKYINQQKIV